MHKRTAHGELEATEESEQALYEQQMKGEPTVNSSVKRSLPVEPAASQLHCAALCCLILLFSILPAWLPFRDLDKHEAIG